MQSFPPTFIIRHRLENLKKCSLRGLENQPGFVFYTYPIHPLPSIENYIVLDLGAPPLTQADGNHGLVLVDATWRYAAKMMQPLLNRPRVLYRSLPPNFRTAYPRRQNDCPDPSRGLASIEALYLSYLILGRPTDHLLDHYYWKEQFLKLNDLLSER